MSLLQFNVADPGDQRQRWQNIQGWAPFQVHVNGYLCKTPHSSVEFKENGETSLFTKIIRLPPVLQPSATYCYLPRCYPLLSTATVARVATTSAYVAVSFYS